MSIVLIFLGFVLGLRNGYGIEFSIYRCAVGFLLRDQYVVLILRTLKIVLSLLISASRSIHRIDLAHFEDRPFVIDFLLRDQYTVLILYTLKIVLALNVLLY